jgi:hypothetical protein
MMAMVAVMTVMAVVVSVVSVVAVVVAVVAMVSLLLLAIPRRRRAGLILVPPIRDLVLALVAHKRTDERAGNHGRLAVAELVAAKGTGGTSGQRAGQAPLPVGPIGAFRARGRRTAVLALRRRGAVVGLLGSGAAVVGGGLPLSAGLAVMLLLLLQLLLWGVATLLVATLLVSAVLLRRITAVLVLRVATLLVATLLVATLLVTTLGRVAALLVSLVVSVVSAHCEDCYANDEF